MPLWGWLALLPAADAPVVGRPANYLGAEGRFTVAWRVEPESAPLGAAREVALELHGAGNIDSLSAPTFAAWKDALTLLRPPRVERTSAGATIRWWLRPRAERLVAVPAATVFTFDPASQPPRFVPHRLPALSLAYSAPAPAPTVESFRRSGAAFPWAWAWLALPVAAASWTCWHWRRRGVPSAPRRQPRFATHTFAPEWLALCDALRLPAGQRTAPEILAAYAARWGHAQDAGALADRLREWDAARFGQRPLPPAFAWPPLPGSP